MEGILGADGSLDGRQGRRLVRARPGVLLPCCHTAVLIGLARVPDEVAPYLREDPDALASRVCGIALNEGAFANGSFTPSDLERLYRRHPTLLAPVLKGSLMAGYDRNPSAVDLPRRDFLRVASRVSVEAYRSGLVHVRTFLPWDYQVEHPAFDRLFAATLRKVRSERSRQ